MTISSYLCFVLGESSKKAGRLHESSLRRMKAFAIAIHIPVTLWAVTGFLIASRIFNLDTSASSAVAVLCAALIYLVERLVLATPKVWHVNLARVVIGVVIALLGATTVDLVIFEREVSMQLRQSGEAQISAEFDGSIDTQRKAIETMKADWLAAQEAANCEANGTCGSRVRSVGPVYRELARQATLLHAEYLAGHARLDTLGRQRSQAISDWRASDKAIQQAGLLSRVEALHQYTMSNPAAFVAWLLFFALVLFFELMVVSAKLVFGETVDDRIDAIREQVSQHKATAYLSAITSPVMAARSLLDATNC